MTVDTVTSSDAAVRRVVASVAKRVFLVGSDDTGFGKFPQSALRTSDILTDPLADVTEFIAETPDFEGTVAVFSPIETLFNGLSHFLALKAKPVVFHALVDSDFGPVSSLRHAKVVFLQSFGSEDAADVAVAAHLVAILLQQPVVHFYTNVRRSAPYNWTSEAIGAAIAEVLLAPQTIPDEVAGESNSPETNGSNGDSGAVEEQSSTDVLANVRPAQKAIAATRKAFSIVGDNLSLYEWRGPAEAETALIVLGAIDELAIAAAASPNKKVGTLSIRLYAPFEADELLRAIPPSVSSLAIVEQIASSTTTWLPLVQNVLSASSEALQRFSSFASYQLGLLTETTATAALSEILGNLASDLPEQGLVIGTPISDAEIDPKLAENIKSVKQLESAYVKVLHQLFPNINLLNVKEQPASGVSTAPEYGFGSYLAQDKLESEQLEVVRQNVTKKLYKDELASLLSKWLAGDHSDALGNKIIDEIKSTGAEIDPTLFNNTSNWLIGSDAWAYDLGNSGVHHVLASGKNLNMLVIDSTPQSELKSTRRRKKDIGLYAMGFSNVYVASVAVYGSYTQLLQAFTEASKYEGPSIVVAYLPYYSPNDDALVVLKETKQAVDTGYWPLYRYNPTLADDKNFILDSFTVRKALRDFLDRENKLTLLSRRSPAFARDLKASYGSEVRNIQKKNAERAYAKLLEGLSGPPLLVLFASDGGQAEFVGRRLARRAKGRGLKATVMAFDDFEAEDLSREQNVVFITSTAGQGEFPQNGRELWESLKSADLDLSTVKISVFGMGDSLYWPRKEDKHYYNKPSHDIWNRVKLLGAQELVPLGQGDDQDADGWSTGYNEWESQVWKALGVDNVAGEDEPAPLTNEDMKRDSNYLRGTIAEGLQDKSTGAISAVDQQLTKFHGIYMQDDRDVRDQRKSDGLEPAYMFMCRVRLPGCVATPEQWLKIDELSDSRGNGTFKITTRGTFQLHGIIKEDLKPAIRGINSVLMDTVAACGDVDRNVVSASLPGNARVHRQAVKVSESISEHLLPRTTAYYEIWLEGADDGDQAGYAKAWDNRKGAFTKKPKTLVGQSPIEDHEPLYGPLYLPRKFKINVAVPPYNDVDVYGHDIGLIAIVENNRDIIGFNVCAGGGMGTTHNNKKTYPRMGSLLGYAPIEKINDVCEKIMLVQRDNGDRTNRKHARLKYTVDDMTVDGFRKEVEKYLGYDFEPAREHPAFTTNVDTYGWVEDEEGYHHFTTFVENGRVEDTQDLQFRSGFREIAEYVKGSDAEFRLTANQHILISNLTKEQRPKVEELLAKYKLDNLSFSGLRLSSAACVAFPTCGLAMAESERYLPILITKIEEILDEYGLRKDSIVMRMTGCPNGCARPWLAELALVGKAFGAYNLMLGGGHYGERLNKLYRSSLKEDEILDTLKPMFKAWALERNDGEHFGDFVVRKGIISAVKEGKDWWDNVEPGLE